MISPVPLPYLDIHLYQIIQYVVRMGQIDVKSHMTVKRRENQLLQNWL